MQMTRASSLTAAFSAGVGAALVGAWGITHLMGLQFRASPPPAAALEREAPSPTAPRTRDLRPAVQAPPSSKAQQARVDIPARQKVERELMDKLISELPADWVTPLEPPSTGEGPTVGGLPHGEWVLFHPVRNWTDRGRYVLGSREGVWKVYDQAGTLVQVRTFVRGKIHGSFKQRSDASEGWQYFTFRDGEHVTD